MICIASPDHVHQVTFDLVTDTPGGDADIYISLTEINPQVATSTWLSARTGSDMIILRTDLNDWTPGYQMVYIGVYGRLETDYTLKVSIEDITASNSKLRGRKKKT